MRSPISCGPFKFSGTNCSRFVNTVIRAGKPKLFYRLKLLFLNPLTPSPGSNVKNLSFRNSLKKHYFEREFVPPKVDKGQLRSVLREPKKTENIQENALWLSGEGYGSWFVIKFKNKNVKIQRFSPEGVLECSGYYKPDKPYSFHPPHIIKITYLSHCRRVILLIDDFEYIFERTEEFVR